MINGKMSTQKTVMCATCETWDQVSGSASSAAREFKRSGWKKTSLGWVCPGCIAIKFGPDAESNKRANAICDKLNGELR